MAEEIDVEQLEKQKAQEYFDYVKGMFPDVDSAYLQSKCIQYAFDKSGFVQFIENEMLTNDYIREVEGVDLTLPFDVHNAWKEFTVELFFKKFPDPIKYFSESDKGSAYVNFTVGYLLRRFKYVSSIKIRRVVRKCNYSLYLSFKEVQLIRKSRKTARTEHEINEGIGRPPSEYYDEVAFIENESAILQYRRDRIQSREVALAEARRTGTLISCGCCFCEEFLAEDIVQCRNGHSFCQECVTRYAEVSIGEGKIDFPCLQECEAFFNVGQLKGLISEKCYEKLERKLQVREVAQANIPGLESCPFCEFSAIPDEENRIFECLNCKKSSCRLCRKKSHLPYNCDEVEDVTMKNRTYVEEKMSEALIRCCHKCGSKFVREEGCNKMSCLCGAIMCYICKKPISDYSHFKEKTNDLPTPGECPLWTNNNSLQKLETERVIEEIKRKNPHIDAEVYKKLRN